MSEQNQVRERVEPEASRPGMQNYGIERQRAGMLPWRHVSEQMEASRNYWIGTTRLDGRPHAAPVWGVWLDETLYFSTDRGSVKGRNLAARPDVVVHLESGDDCVIIEGVVEEVHDLPLRTRFAEVYDAKYQFRPDPNGDGLVYALRPRTVFAWLERDFPKTATRWRFDHP